MLNSSLPCGARPEFISEMTMPPFLRAQADGLLLSVKLQPRASANEIGEALGNELRIKVTAPPVDAAANEALIKLLAQQLHCPRNRVDLVRGHTSRHKTVKLYGLAAGDVVAKLGQA
jgi:uncharacterized protein (TIGR00251 family)